MCTPTEATFAKEAAFGYRVFERPRGYIGACSISTVAVLWDQRRGGAPPQHSNDRFDRSSGPKPQDVHLNKDLENSPNKDDTHMS